VPTAAADGTLFVVIGRPPAGTRAPVPASSPLPASSRLCPQGCIPSGKLRHPAASLLCHAIQQYVDVASRKLVSDEPLCQYLYHYHAGPDPEGEEPLTGEAVAQALKRYAAEAGVDPESITIHSLRHLGAELYYAASGDVHETQRFLDHKRLDTTSIYLEQLTGQEHKHWQAMAKKLGV
jgi:integrase